MNDMSTDVHARGKAMCQGLFLALMLSIGTTSHADQELRVWSNNDDRGRQAAFRAFEERHPGWRLVISTYRGADAQKLMTAIVGGDPPDMILQDRFSIGEWASREAFMNLNDFIAQSQKDEQAGGPQGIDPDAFYPACWEEATYKGMVYAIPFNSDVRVLYCDEDALREAGFVDAQGRAKPPRTWKELRQYAIALTTRDKHGHVTRLGFAPNYGNSWLFIYAWLNGGSFMSADGKTVTMNQPPIVEAMKYMAQLYDDVGGVQMTDAFLGATIGNEYDPFATGRLAMKIDGDWQLNKLAEYHPDTRFLVAMAPAPEGHQSTTWSGGYSYVIPAGAKHAKMAFELIRFLVSDEGWNVQHDINMRYASSRGLAFIPRITAQPAVNDHVLHDRILKDPNVPPRVARALPMMYDLMKIARFRPVSPVGQLLWDQQVRAIDQVVRGHEDPKKVFDKATAVVQEQLDEILNQQHHQGAPVNWTGLTTTLLLVIAGVAIVLWVAAWRRGVWARYRRDEVMAGLFFVFPWMLGFLVLMAGPIVMSLVYAFCRYNVLQPAHWSGLHNFSNLLFHDKMFWHALANTAYMLMGVPLGMTVGLGIALLLNTEVRGMKIYRTVFYLPAIVPIVASSILWIWVLNPQNGMVNEMLRMIGVTDPPLWLNSPSWLFGSKASILLMGLWGAGGGMIIWLAGLKGIPAHLYEAAKIDGAGPIRCFVHVTLPMLTPYIFFNAVMGAIHTMQIFSQAFIMTGGGPADSTMFYAYYLFNQAFYYFRMGYASALAWVLLLIVLVLTSVQMWASKHWVHYSG